MRQRRNIVAGAIALLFVMLAIGVYAYFEARALFLGPQVFIATPADGENFSKPAITISGHSYNVSYLFLNNNPIFVDAGDAFSEKILLLPGYNAVTVEARDRFGKKAEKTLELTYTPATTTATSTPTP